MAVLAEMSILVLLRRMPGRRYGRVHPWSKGPEVRQERCQGTEEAVGCSESCRLLPWYVPASHISCQITQRPRGSDVWNRRHGGGDITSRCNDGRAWRQAPHHAILSPDATWKLPACVESHDCCDKQLHIHVTIRDGWLWTGCSFLRGQPDKPLQCR